MEGKQKSIFIHKMRAELLCLAEVLLQTQLTSVGKPSNSITIYTVRAQQGAPSLAPFMPCIIPSKLKLTLTAMV